MKKQYLFMFLFFVLLTYCVDEVVEPETKSPLTLVSPNGGEIYYLKSLHIPVEWTQTNIENIDILYSIDYLENWEYLVSKIDAGVGSRQCEIPNIIADSIRIRIKDSNNEQIYDDSDGFFSIKENDDPYSIGKAKILTPCAGEVLTGMEKYVITWSNGDRMSNISLHYSLDDGMNWNEVIVDAKISSGKYEWIVPNQSSKMVRIKLTAFAVPYPITIVSEGLFSIKAVDRDKNTLAYFPLNIGDIKIFSREISDPFEVEKKLFKTEQVIIKDTLIDSEKYFVVESETINLNTSEKTKGFGFVRVDSLSKNVYQYYSNSDSEQLILNLELIPNEIYEIDSEHYVVLLNQERIITFGMEINSKTFQRKDIYGYTGHTFQLLENIGIYVDSYSAEGYSRKDNMIGAVIDGVVYGDTTRVGL